MIKKALASTAAALLLVGALATTAGAASNGSTTATEPTAADQHAGRVRHHVLRGAIRLAALTAADTIGVDPSELRDAVRNGQTIGELAESKGVSTDEVEQAIVDALTARIDRALAEGRISEVRAAAAKERAGEFAARVVNTLPRRVQAPTAG